MLHPLPVGRLARLRTKRQVSAGARRVSRLVGALTVGIVGLAGTQVSLASSPEQFEMPVTFRTSPAPVDNGRSIRDLTGWRSVEDYSHTIGLYRQLTRAVVSVEGELLAFGKAALLRPTRASLDISTDHHIYVGSEFPPGSCQYESALEHERMHEQIHVEAVEALLPELEREVRAQLRAMPTDPRIPLHEQLSTAAHRAGSLVRQMIAERTSALHAAFDSPAEYERVQAACGGAMGQPRRTAHADGLRH